MIIISEAKLQVVLKAYYQHPDFKSVPSFLGEAPMSVESIECHLELHEQKKVEEKKEGQDQFAQREERLEWMTTPIELKDLFKNRSLKPNEPEKEINTVLDTCVDVNQEAVQEEKIELFFDEFIDLLRKYNEAGTEKLDLIKADLEALCDRYGKYGADPLGKKYTWGDDTYTPLQFAARQGNQAVIEVLCSEGYRARAFIYAKTDICGSTALHLATEGGHSHIVKHLLSLDQGLANAQDKEGQSALHYATYGKHVNLAT
ncbi:MAG: ankyrin repeat domain-containing protein [Bacteroidota bacterium]